jgi:endoribonuclease LACTB2
LNAIPIHAANPGPITGEGNWTWLLPGRVPTLIDAGTGEAQHLAALEAALGKADLAQVLITHAHTDHAAGAPLLAQRFPRARFLKMPWPERDAKWPVPYEPIADGARIAAGDGNLVVLHTPGHAPDHVVFWDEETRSVFCGDLAMKGATVWIPAHLGGDLAQYLRSLERVIELAPVRMLPAHGAVIDEPVALLRGYIAHRLEREQQIIVALEAGQATPEAITTAVYRGLKPQLLPMAQEGVIAHLKKLEQEGRASQANGRWQFVNS